MLGALTSRPPRRPPAAGGLTLVEIMVTLAILGIAVAIALPSLNALVARKRLESMAQELLTDLRLIKAQQIQTRSVYGTAISVSSNDSKTCYTLFVPGNQVFNCDCALAPEEACAGTNANGIAPQQIRQVDIPRSTGITLSSNRALLLLASYNGLPRSGNTMRLTLTSSAAGELVVSTNPLGVASLCSMSGSFSGIKPCE